MQLNVGSLHQNTACGECFGISDDSRRHAASCTRLCNDCIWKRQTSWMHSIYLTTWTSSLAPQVWKPEAIGGQMVSLRSTIRVTLVQQHVEHKKGIASWTQDTWYLFSCQTRFQIQMFILCPMIQIIGTGRGWRGVAFRAPGWRLREGERSFAEETFTSWLHRKMVHRPQISHFFAHTLVN